MPGVEYVTGAESQKETGEPHALQGDPDPLDMQAITFCFAVDYIEGEDHTIERPRDYDFWREYHPSFWPNRLLDWTHPHPITLEPRQRCLFPHEESTPFQNLWMYRRIIDKSNFAPGTYASDISLINWPQIDYWEGPVFEVPEEEVGPPPRRGQAAELVIPLLDADRGAEARRRHWLPRPPPAKGYRRYRRRPRQVPLHPGVSADQTASFWSPSST